MVALTLLVAVMCLWTPDGGRWSGAAAPQNATRRHEGTKTHEEMQRQRLIEAGLRPAAGSRMIAKK
ncbi:MAG TPA: hypothetical protein VFZ31_04955 [Vicinamibacterales bacterium]